MFNFTEILDGVFAPGTDEYDAIKDTYDTITSSVPVIAAEARATLVILDNCRAKLSTIYFMLNRTISQKTEVIQQTYDAQYMRLVKLGRPSKDAIEAEIRATNPQYAGICVEVKRLEDVKELINMYIRCIDNCRQNTLEMLKNIFRVD